MKRRGKVAAAGLFAAPLILIAALGAAEIATNQGGAVAPSAAAQADIPTNLIPIYQAAAATECPGLPWTVLAGIGKVETNHDRSTLPGVHTGANSAGAEGSMQFLPATFAAYGTDGNGDGRADIYNTDDAIYTAARYLCANGGGSPATLRSAIYAYNHAGWYVNQVLTNAQRYASTATLQITPVAYTGTGAGQIAVAFARTRLGIPYLWGGETNAGFDCSGLTQTAWRSAGVTIPRTADAQYRALPPVPGGLPQQPGDLVFYGTTTHVHHVGIYLGNGLMIDAPYTGADIRIEPYREPDYLAAARPVM